MTSAIETALTELSANLRRMEQRHQAVGYKFDRLYDLIAAARVELANLTADAGSRESRMVVLRRSSDGAPAVWCDPEIADLVGALNSGGVPTVASCSGHGEKPGGIALSDGRQLLILDSLDAFNSAMTTLGHMKTEAAS